MAERLSNIPDRTGADKVSKAVECGGSFHASSILKRRLIDIEGRRKRSRIDVITVAAQVAISSSTVDVARLGHVLKRSDLRCDDTGRHLHKVHTKCWIIAVEHPLARRVVAVLVDLAELKRQLKFCRGLSVGGDRVPFGEFGGRVERRS